MYSTEGSAKAAIFFEVNTSTNYEFNVKILMLLSLEIEIIW